MRFYQQFVLDRRELEAERLAEGRLPTSFNPDNARVLITNLQAQGYEVLIGHEALNGMPTDIIVGCEDFQDPKSGFGRITRDLGLQFFRSEKYYMKQ